MSDKAIIFTELHFQHHYALINYNFLNFMQIRYDNIKQQMFVFLVSSLPLS